MQGFRDLAGKTAVVTGGASGIGRGLAERFLREGMNVVIADVEPARLEQAAADIGAFAVHTDVSDAASVEALAAAAVARFGAVHVVCNNAGVGPFHSSSSTCPNNGMSLRSVASLRNKSARSRSRASTSASLAAFVAFACQSRQSAGICSR